MIRLAADAAASRLFHDVYLLHYICRARCARQRQRVVMPICHAMLPRCLRDTRHATPFIDLHMPLRYYAAIAAFATLLRSIFDCLRLT